MGEDSASLKAVPLEPAVAQGRESEDLVLGASRIPLWEKVLRTFAAAAIAFVSIFVFAPALSDPQFHAGTIEVLDEKKANVVGLAAAAAAASVAVEAIPGEGGSSIAAELADLSSDFGIIVIAILLEKYLLTVLSLASFGVLVPLACVLYVGRIWSPGFGARTQSAAVKIALLSVVLAFVVPVSTLISQIIDETFDASLVIAEASDVERGQDVDSAVQQETGEEAFSLESIASFFDNSADAVSEAISGAADWATTALGNLMEAFAVMIITSCVIPILVIALALWVINLILGIDTRMPMAALKGRAWRAPMRAGRSKIADAARKEAAHQSGD